MKIVVDTSSLISLSRYYLPFDRNSFLFNLIKGEIESGEIIVIDKVYEECEFTSKGIVLNSLFFLREKKNLTKTLDLLPSHKFFNQVENQFFNGSVKNILSNVEFENRKEEFLKSADAKLLLYCLSKRSEDKDIDIIIVTEESEFSNDKKAFKKIPALCNILELSCSTLPELFKRHYKIKIEFKS